MFIGQNKKCSISGIDIVLSYNRYGDIEQTASLDRIDNSKGYVEGNLQWTNKWINKMKLHFSDEEFINWCYLVVQNNYNFIIEDPKSEKQTLKN